MLSTNVGVIKIIRIQLKQIRRFLNTSFTCTVIEGLLNELFSDPYEHNARAHAWFF